MKSSALFKLMLHYALTLGPVMNLLHLNIRVLIGVA